MEISVIMCAYNAQQYLKQSIESILNQSFTDFDLLIVDDCSTDDTASIIQSYAVRDNRIRYLSTSDTSPGNSGPSVARNTGMEASSGKYVYFVDADDLLEPDMLKFLWQRAESTGSEIVCCGYFMETDGMSRKFLYNDFDASTLEEIARHIPSLQSKQLMNVLWNKLFRRDLIERAGARFPVYMRSGQDRHFNLFLIAQTESFSFVNLPLYHYVVRKEGITYGYFNPDRFIWASEIFSMQRALFEKFNILTQENLAALSFMFIKVVLSCYSQLFYKSCAWSISEKKTYVRQISRQEVVISALEAAKPHKLAQKIVLAGLRTGSPSISLVIAWMTAYSSRYLQPLLIRLKY